MAVEIEYTDEYGDWWASLNELEQDSVTRVVLLLETLGTRLAYPYSSAIKGSRHSLRELRIQHQGTPYRVLYAFDPHTSAILLLGGDKTGDDRWYEVNVPTADRLYDVYLEEIKKERQV